MFVLLLVSLSQDKKLIEFGWDEPDPKFMRSHVKELEKTPFDGCVFHVNHLTWEGWGTRAFAKENFATEKGDLQETPFVRFVENFLRFNTTPAKIDWFDDFSAVLNNARIAGWLAKEGKCRGILFDIEQYEGPLFDYRRQRDFKTKSWEVYATQVRLRGREVMRSFQEEYPGLTVFLTFGFSLPWHTCRQGKKPLADSDYGMLAPFLDGMLEAAEKGSKLVDGHELSYGYRDPKKFAKEYQTMKEDLQPIVADVKKYDRVFSLGFGVWMDNDWKKKGWHVDDFSRNHFTPEAFEASLRAALASADRYVWIYTETPRWWSASGEPVKMPDAYVQAVRRALASK